jgi:long-chain acyl-CoA synthetase
MTPGMLVHRFLEDTAARTPDSTALVVGADRRTFRQVDRDSDTLAAALQARGVDRGDRVAIMAESSAELVVALWATLKAGAVFVVVNPTTKADQLAYVLRDCGVRLLVSQARLARVVVPALADSPGVATTLWIGGVPDTGTVPVDTAAPVPVHHEDLAAVAGADPGATPIDPGLIDADLAGLIYTSGSTGRPKGVMLTHRNVVHSTWSISTYLGLRADDVVACLLPPSFGYGLFHIFMGARIGCRVVVEPGFAFPHDTLVRLAETGVTVLPGVPTLFATLLQLAPFDPDLDLSAVRMLTNAAAALAPAHVERLRAAFPGAQVFCMYGLTEATRVAYLDPARLDDKLGSVGMAMPNTEAYVVDENGKRAAPGVVGELVVRGASVMRGYWGKPEATAACLHDGEIEGEKVLRTGDQFWADDEGFLWFVGRGDDVFKCKGEKISPAEVEQVLYELDAVAEAAVVGVPHPIDGTAVKAVVAPRAGASLDEAMVRRHCRARLEGYMVPRFVDVRTHLPKTESGKIRRASLVEGPEVPEEPPAGEG